MAAFGDGRVRSRAMPACLALAVHAIVLLGVVRLAVWPPPPEAAPAGYAILLDMLPPSPATPAQEPPVPQPPTAAAALPMTPPADQPASVTPPAARHPYVPHRTHLAAPASRQASVAAPNPVDPQPPKPPTPPPDDSGAALASLEARIDAAVRDAAVMPESARRQHRQGSARLRFRYLDGAVDGLVVIVSSNSRVLDDAALHAIQTAHYPVPPLRLRGRRLDLLVWVDFRLDPHPG